MDGATELLGMLVGSVLVLEDDPLIAMNVEAVARDIGVEQVHVANSPEAALQLASSEPLAGAILDVMMAGDETYAVADVLAARGIPFIFSTGLTRADIVERHRQRPVLSKPYLDQQLEDWLGWIARHSAALAAE